MLIISFHDLIIEFDLSNRKYEEITPPHVEDFCYITDNTYRRDEVNISLHRNINLVDVTGLSILRYGFVML